MMSCLVEDLHFLSALLVYITFGVLIFEYRCTSLIGACAKICIYFYLFLIFLNVDFVNCFGYLY